MSPRGRSVRRRPAPRRRPRAGSSPRRRSSAALPRPPAPPSCRASDPARNPAAISPSSDLTRARQSSPPPCVMGPPPLPPPPAPPALPPAAPGPASAVASVEPTVAVAVAVACGVAVGVGVRSSGSSHSFPATSGSATRGRGPFGNSSAGAGVAVLGAAGEVASPDAFLNTYEAPNATMTAVTPTSTRVRRFMPHLRRSHPACGRARQETRAV